MPRLIPCCDKLNFEFNFGYLRIETGILWALGDQF